uniref:C-C motif chemokine n=1 Tax=Cynoglossus semilaevis TaxID=244447 RepID=A0A3P8W9E0_CYNSE
MRRYCILSVISALFKCPRMCCTQYNEKPIPVKFLKYYKVQEMRGYCNIKAVVFTTLKNRFVCANPNSKWVQRAMDKTEKEKRILKKSIYETYFVLF